MKKIRDLIYDYNDIFVAAIIIAAAAAVIFWRLNSIVDYPKYLASKDPGTQNEVNMDNIDLTPGEVIDNLNGNPEDANSDSEEGDAAETTTPSAVEPATPTVQPGEEVKFEIPSGSSAAKIGTLLKQAGLIESEDDFIKELTAQGAEKKLKAGTFKIPGGSDVKEIIRIITK